MIGSMTVIINTNSNMKNMKSCINKSETPSYRNTEDRDKEVKLMT